MPERGVYARHQANKNKELGEVISRPRLHPTQNKVSVALVAHVALFKRTLQELTAWYSLLASCLNHFHPKAPKKVPRKGLPTLAVQVKKLKFVILKIHLVDAVKPPYFPDCTCSKVEISCGVTIQ